MKRQKELYLQACCTLTELFHMYLFAEMIFLLLELLQYVAETSPILNSEDLEGILPDTTRSQQNLEFRDTCQI